jgi:hypothetical protein
MYGGRTMKYVITSLLCLAIMLVAAVPTATAIAALIYLYME